MWAKEFSYQLGIFGICMPPEPLAGALAGELVPFWAETRAIVPARIARNFILPEGV